MEEEENEPRSEGRKIEEEVASPVTAPPKSGRLQSKYHRGEGRWARWAPAQPTPSRISQLERSGIGSRAPGRRNLRRHRARDARRPDHWNSRGRPVAASQGRGPQSTRHGIPREGPPRPASWSRGSSLRY